MAGALDCVRNWRLHQIERFFMYVIIWICIIVLHSSFQYVQHRNIVLEEDLDELEKVVLKEKDFAKSGGVDIENKLSPEDLDRVKKKEMEESAHIKERDAQELKRLVEEKAKRFKPTSKYTEKDVLQWFSERKLPTGKYEDIGKHPKLPKYIIEEKDICKNNRVDFLFYFNSHPSNFQKRIDLRNSWAGLNSFKSLVVKTIFIVGNAEKKEKDQAKKLIEESKKYHDIIQGNMNDTVRNISLKALLMLDWVSQHCSQAKFIVKADDDVFVNPFLMIENMISLIWKKRQVLMCHIKKDNKVISDIKSKWYISQDVLPKEHKEVLPQFCAGYVVLFSGNLVPLMRKNAKDSPIIPVDDVFLFGFLIKGIKDLEIVNAIDHLTLNLEKGLEEYIDYKREITHVAVSAWHPRRMERLWDKTVDRLTPLGKQLANSSIIPAQ